MLSTHNKNSKTPQRIKWIRGHLLRNGPMLATQIADDLALPRSPAYRICRDHFELLEDRRIWIKGMPVPSALRQPVNDNVPSQWWEYVD